jgi:hypothetical protein
MEQLRDLALPFVTVQDLDHNYGPPTVLLTAASYH